MRGFASQCRAGIGISGVIREGLGMSGPRREQLESVEALSPESQGQNLVLTV